MKKSRSIVKGTPAQFEGALERRIAELGGEVEACDKITASSETTYLDTHGIMGEIGDIWTVSELRKYWDAEHLHDPVLSEYDSFENWLEDTISFMTRIDRDDTVSAARSDDNTYAERYIHTLIGDIQSEFEGTVDSMKFDTTDDSLIITAVLGNEVKEFIVPYSDLKFDWNKIDVDTQYICNEIDEEFNREYLDDNDIDTINSRT